MIQAAPALWLAQTAGLVAGLGMLLLIYRLGRGAFSRSLFFVGLSIGGIVAATIALALSPLDMHANPYHFSVAAQAFGFAGFPEEAGKIAGLYLFFRPYYLRRSARDLALGAASIALGFGLLENTLYIALAGAHWQSTVVTRAFVSAPFHLLLGLASAMAVVDRAGREIATPSWARLGGVWLALSLLHGSFDFALMAMPAPTSIPALVGVAQFLHVDPRAVLAAGVFAATAITGVCAYRSLRRLDRAEPDNGAFSSIGRRWWARALLSRTLGAIIAVLMILSVAFVILVAVFSSFIASDAGAAELAIGMFAVPFTTGVLFARWPRPSARAKERAKIVRRWGLRGLAAAAAFAVAAAVAFPTRTLAPVRFALAAKYAVEATRLAGQADLEGALERLDRALSWRPDAPELLVARADLRAQLGRFADAEADFDAALRLKPNDVGFLASRSDNQLAQGDVRGALADIDAALAVEPNNARLQAARVGPDLASGDSARADQDVARAAYLRPDEPKVAFAKAQIAVERGDYVRATDALTRRFKPGAEVLDLDFMDGRVLYYGSFLTYAERKFAAVNQRVTNLYPALWLQLTQMRERKVGKELADRLAKAPPNAWPSRLARMLLGQASEVDTLADVANEAQRCEFYFYAGELRQVHADQNGARALFSKAKEICPFNFVEAEGARVEMRRLLHDGALGVYNPPPSP